MRPRHIEIFNAVFTAGSVTSAARLLHITQPTASKMLLRLEDELGFMLFTRIKGKLIPTSEARILFEETAKISRYLSALGRTTENLRRSEGSIIKLAVVHALGVDLLPRAVVDYRKRSPGSRFMLQTHHYDNILASISEHDKDVGIALNPVEKPGFTYIDLTVGEFVCIYANGEFDDYPERLSLQDLEEHPFIGIDDSGPLGDLIATRIRNTGISNNTTIQAQAYYLVRNLVAFGAGISIVDEFTAQSMAPATVKYKRLDPPLMFEVKAFHLENRPPSKATTDFLDYFRQQLVEQHVASA